MAVEKDIAAATRDTAQTSEAATRRAAEAVRRMAGETVGQAASTTAAAGQRAGDHATHLLNATAGAGGTLAEQGQRGVDALTQYNAALMAGVQDLWREWMAFNQEAMERRMDAWSMLLRTPTPQNAFAVQSQWLKDEMTIALNRGIRMSQMAATALHNAAGRVDPRQP